MYCLPPPDQRSRGAEDLPLPETSDGRAPWSVFHLAVDGGTLGAVADALCESLDENAEHDVLGLVGSIHGRTQVRAVRHIDSIKTSFFMRKMSFIRLFLSLSARKARADWGDFL